MLPLVRLDVSQTQFFWISPGTRILCSRVFSRKYGECLILNDACYAIAHVSNTGQLRMLGFPYNRYEMWQIVNIPERPECPCANFFDPEIQGPWRLRDSERHHPMCIYERSAMPVFRHFERPLPLYPLPEEGQEVDKDVEKAIKRHTSEVAKEIAVDTRKHRPDAWVRTRDEIEGRPRIVSR